MIDQLYDIQRRGVISVSLYRRALRLLKIRADGGIWIAATIRRGLNPASRMCGMKSGAESRTSPDPR
jgi:hypothetical protein